MRVRVLIFIQLLTQKEQQLETWRNTIHNQQGEIPFWPFLFVGLPRINSTYFSKKFC
jgi:hypothetical protein